jgi:hypothetical protein
MSSTTPLSRRDFTRIAAASAGVAALGCSPGIFSPEQELVLTLSGRGRLFDGSGKVLANESLAPGIASGPVGGAVIRPGSVSSGIGTLRIPAPSLIGFAQSPPPRPQVSTRVDRAADGTVVESRFESLGNGIPIRRTVRVPSHGVEIIDAHDFRQLRDLAVFEQRRIELRQHGQLVADLTIAASGEVRLATGPRFRPTLLARAFLPQELQAQSDCGIQLVLHFLSATLGVIAALGTCASGPWCIIALFGALIEWAQVIGEMETCRQT